jgi:hypothetical protein
MIINGVIILGNNVGDEGAKFIAAVLEKNDTVTSISLSGEWIESS